MVDTNIVMIKMLLEMNYFPDNIVGRWKYISISMKKSRYRGQ